MGEYAFKIDIDPKLDSQLKEVEKKFEGIATKSQQTQKTVDEAFSKMASGGIDTFLTKLQSVENKLSNLKVGQSNGIAAVGTAAQSSAEQVDKLLAVIAGMAQALSVKKSGGRKTITDELKELKPTGVDNVKAALDRMIESLSKARSDIRLYKEAIGTGKKSYISFGQEGLKEANAKAEQLMRTITALDKVYSNLRGSEGYFKNYINQISGADAYTQKHKKDLEDLKNFIIEKNNIEQKSIANEKARQDAFHNRATAKMNALYKEAEAEVKKERDIAKAAEKRDADFHKRATARINQIYKEQEAEEKKNAAIIAAEEKRYNSFHKRSTSKIDQIYKEYDAEVKALERRDKAMMANSDKAMNRVLENIRKEEEARRKVIESQNPQSGSRFSALSAVTEWKGLNNQIQEASRRIETIKKIMADFSGKQGKETVLKYYAKEVSILESSIAKWRSKQQVIVDTTSAIAAQEKFKKQMLNDAQGGLDFERQKSQAKLDAMRQYYQEQEKLAKIAYENRIKEAKDINLKKNKSYEGSIKFSDTAKTEDRHRKALEFLLEARKKLTTADTEYASKLDELNTRIARHRQFLKQAAMTTEELAKARQKEKAAQKDAFFSANSANALSFSQNAKSVNDQIRAIKYLSEARNKLNKNDKNYESTLSQLNNEIRRNKREMDIATEGANRLRSSHNNLMDTADQLKRSLALMFSVSAVKNYVNSLVSVRGEFELQQRSLEAILQDKDEANTLWNKTVQLAVKSPFRVGELVSYTKQLAAYRIESDKLYETNKMLADISAGLGVDMGRLILAYGQVKAANYLRGTELRQFSEAGVNILGELSKYFTELEGTAVSVGDVFERVSKRMVSFEDVTKVLKNLTSESGIFYEMQEKQAETMKGMVSNLRDSIDLMLNEIGKSGEGVLKGSLSFVKNLVDNWELMATAIKGVVVALAIYKINALLSADATAKFVYESKHLTRQISHQVTMTQLASAAWRKFKFSIKGAALSMKAFAASNLWLLGLSSVASAIYEVVNANKALNEKMKAINDKRDEEIVKVKSLTNGYKKLLNEQNKSGNQSEKELSKNLEGRKAILKDMQEIAKGHGIEIPINLKEEDEESIEKKINDFKEKIEFSINFGSELDASIADELTSIEGWFHMFGDNLQTDMEEFSNSFGQLGGRTREIVKLSMNEIGAMYDELTDKGKEYFDSIKDGKKDTETDEEYLLRQIEYLQKINNLHSKVQSNVGGSFTVVDYELRNGKALYEVDKKRLDIMRHRSEFEHELSKVADSIIKKYGDISKLSDWQKKTIQLKIDKAFEKMELNESAKRAASFFLSKRFGLPISLIIKPKEGNLDEWQKKVLDAVTSLNAKLEGKYQIRFGVENVQGKTKEQVQNYVKGMLETAKRAVEIYEKLRGEQKIVSEEEYDKYKNRLPILEKMAHVVGLPDEGAKKREQEQVKILNDRIKLIKDIHKEYKDLNKTMDSTTAKEKVISAYGETFKKAFEGTEIDLSHFVIDENKIDNAVGTLTEEVKKKLKELKDKGTYIRSFTEEFIKTLIDNERKVNQAYLDSGGKVTIGIGNTVDSKGNPIKLGDYWDDERILKENTILFQQYADALNSVLDKNKDLIVTQEQYNALLDVTWQAGKGGVKDIIAYARDVEKFKDWLEKIKNLNVTNGLYGSARKVKRINDINVDEEIEKYQKLKNVYEKMAFVAQYVGVRIAGTNDTTEGMLKRGKKRSEQLSTGLALAENLQKVVTNIADVDFTNLPGVYEILKKLRDIAKKEGKESVLDLEKEMSHVKAQIEVEARLTNIEAFDAQIEEMFEGYQMSLELQKIGVPEDVIAKFTGDIIDEEDLRNQVSLFKEQLESLGEKGIAIWEKYKDKLDDITDKLNEDRLKRFLSYLDNVEQTILKAQNRGAFDIQMAFKMFEDGKIDVQQYVEMVRGIIGSVNDEISKAKVGELKRTPEYIKAMGDVSMYSRRELTKMLNVIEDLMNESSDALNASDMKVYQEAISRIKNQLEETEMPWNKSEFGKIKQMISLQKELEEEEENEKNLLDEQMQKKAELKVLQEELNELVRQQESGDNSKELSNQITEKNEQITNTTKEVEGLDNKLSKSGIKIGGIVGKMGALSGGAGKTLAMVDMIVKAVYQSINATIEMFNELKSLAESFGKDVEGGKWQQATTFFKYMGEMNDKVMGSWESFKKGDMAGASVKAVGAVFSVIKGINAMHDNKREKIIIKQQELVEKLTKAYKDLEESVENAFSVNTLKQSAHQTEQNIKAQMDAIYKMIYAEEDKKKTDKDRIKEWKEQLDVLREQLKEVQESVLSDLGVFGNEKAYKDAAQQFADAWYEAYKETGDGLKALDETYDNFIDNMVKKQLLVRGTEAILKPLLKMIDDAVANDYTLTRDELDRIHSQYNDKTKGQLNDLYQSLMDELGIKPDGTSKLSGLQEGIQGITEETAQIIESYLNSVRFFVADTNSKITSFFDSFTNTETDNPMVSQLRIVAANTTAIRSLLDSLTAPHPTQNGRGLKVII